MSKEWTNYIEYLVSIGRNSSQDLTNYENSHLIGLLMKNSDPTGKIFPVLDDIVDHFINWMVTQEVEQEKLLLNAARDKAIELYKPMIDDLIKHQIECEENLKKEPDQSN